MDGAHILIVEDEPDIGSMLARYLEGRGFSCDWVTTAMEAERSMEEKLPDLVVLDWMLPGRSGYEFARALRAAGRTKRVPVIMLTARDSEADKVEALEVGADDYVTKPFSLKEFAARINALLRRSSDDTPEQAVEVAGLAIDRGTRRVTTVGVGIPLGPTEFELLYFLATHRERVYSREELMQQVWDPRVRVEPRTVDVHIGRLRRALRRSGHDRLIQTVRGAGYRLSVRE